MPHLSINTILNKNCYQIKKVIGQGGFGITYLADEIGFYRNTGFGDTQYVKANEPEKVVIKELFYSEYCVREQNCVVITNQDKRHEFSKLVQNQLDEGKKLRMLNHPNVVHTRDIFKENDTAYMVMDYIDSYDLDDMLAKKGKLSKESALKYISQILSALVHIHEQNQLHLDIKPSNILIRKDTDSAILIDFGASQSYDTTGNIVGRTSQLIGGMTKHYAPNEQADIDNLKHFDATFDTYAIGATLYHLLTGKKPPVSSLLSTGREKLVLPTQLCELKNDYLDAVVSKALAPLYHNRFKTATDFLQELSKENDYSAFIDEVGLQIKNHDFLLAKKLITETKQNYLQTPTLDKYQETINREEQRATAEKEFNKYCKQGMVWMNKNEFYQAIDLFEKAQKIHPEREDILENIIKCKEALLQENQHVDNEETIIIASKTKEMKKEKDDEETIILSSDRKKTDSRSDDDDKTIVISKLRQETPVKKLSPLKKLTSKQIRNGAIVLASVAMVLIIVFLITNNQKKEAINNREKPSSVNPIFTTKTPVTVNKPQAELSTESSVGDKRNQEEKQPFSKEEKSEEKPEIKKADVNAVQSQTEKTDAVSKSKITFHGKKYEGKMANGIPNGVGTLYYNSSELVSENDAKKTMANSGDYLKGKWNNGELEYGTLYDSSGNKKASIIIGRY